MMTDTFYFFAALLVSVLITFGLRALPFIAFRGGRKMPSWMQRLGEILPSAIMAVLIVYCLRGAHTDFAGTGIPGLVAVLATGLSYKWRHNTFLSIALGTAVYMLLLRVL